MIQINNVPNVLFGFIQKIFTYESGALILLASPLSDFLIKATGKLVADRPILDFALPFLIGAICMILYSIVFMVDFITGIRASRHNGNPIISSKLWSSIWKIAVICLIIFCLSNFSIVFSLLGLETLKMVFTYAIAIISIMAILFDIHSIGENHKKRFGKKPAIFDWLDSMTEAIKEGIIKKLKNLF